MASTGIYRGISRSTAQRTRLSLYRIGYWYTLPSVRVCYADVQSGSYVYSWQRLASSQGKERSVQIHRDRPGGPETSAISPRIRGGVRTDRKLARRPWSLVRHMLYHIIRYTLHMQCIKCNNSQHSIRYGTAASLDLGIGCTGSRPRTFPPPACM